MQIQSENPSKQVQDFVKADPYVCKNLVESYEIKEFAMTDTTKDFERLALGFMTRS
jgi:hypothetical protein